MVNIGGPKSILESNIQRGEYHGEIKEFCSKDERKKITGWEIAEREHIQVLEIQVINSKKVMTNKMYMPKSKYNERGQLIGSQKSDTSTGSDPIDIPSVRKRWNAWRCYRNNR